MAFISSIQAVTIPLFVVFGLCYLFLWRFRFSNREWMKIPHHDTSLLWGSINVVRRFMKGRDPREIQDYVLIEMRKDLGNPPIMFVDPRPALPYAMCSIFSHEVAEQLSKATKFFPWSAPKSPMESLYPVIGTHSISVSNGEKWKSLRRRYNPGFAPQHLISLMPPILEKVSVFLEKLDKLAESQEEFLLDDLCTGVTFDIIGTVIMDYDMCAQMPSEQQSDMVKDFKDLLESYSKVGNPLTKFKDPFSKWRQRRLGRKVDHFIQAIILEKFLEMKSSKAINADKKPSGGTKKGRSVLDLSLQDVDELTPLILQQTSDQIRTFLFAGHDTTSILLQWIFYELSRHPQILATVRQEHDTLFGSNASIEVIRERLLDHGEDIISRMTYTSAIIKEALRLHPPASTARYIPQGTGFRLTLPDGHGEVILDGMILYIMHYAIQRDPTVYGDTATDFVPERWLGDSDTTEAATNNPEDGKTSSGVPASSWRPFERGPRNCIGQELANLETRLILACALRRYDFCKVGLGELELDSNGNPIMDEKKRRYKVNGEIFCKRKVTAKPVDSMRMKVKMHKRNE